MSKNAGPNIGYPADVLEKQSMWAWHVLSHLLYDFSARRNLRSGFQSISLTFRNPSSLSRASESFVERLLMLCTLPVGKLRAISINCHSGVCAALGPLHFLQLPPPFPSSYNNPFGNSVEPLVPHQERPIAIIEEVWMVSHLLPGPNPTICCSRQSPELRKNRRCGNVIGRANRRRFDGSDRAEKRSSSTSPTGETVSRKEAHRPSIPSEIKPYHICNGGPTASPPKYDMPLQSHPHHLSTPPRTRPRMPLLHLPALRRALGVL